MYRLNIMNLKIAKILLIIASLFPISVGIYYYFFFISFTDFRYIEHIAFTNLIYSGVALFTLAAFGPKPNPKPWVLFLIFFNLIWTIGNDTCATVRFFCTYKGYLTLSISSYSSNSCINRWRIHHHRA